jgi:hypothetical protein
VKRQTDTHVNSPNTCARADVQYVPWLLYGREVKLAVKGQAQNVVLEIQAIRLALKHRQ